MSFTAVSDQPVRTTREFRAMNTDWWIEARGCADLHEIEVRVHEAEAAFSRFRASSLLSRLNRDRRVVDAELAALVRRALEMQVATRGVFDPRVGLELVAAGYDRSFELLSERVEDRIVVLAPPVELLTLDVQGSEVRLAGVGALDLSGIAKGWTIDQLAEALQARGCRDYLIDGGGDIRAGGVGEGGLSWAVGVGDGLAIRLADRAVCTSSKTKRRWRTPRGEAHHIIDPLAGGPSRSAVTTAVVVADDATTADSLATAVIADPEAGLRAVVQLGGEALMDSDETWEMTPGMKGLLI